ncbi:MAG: 3-phosphoshikimate 1-carboxyvinyltransferase [Candidatus Diapherotrites archaeon]|nr:3-phosphoshikimate 1-carboxyvinyltransferase [Candidatus Diapherotrites archaeon]
MELAVRKSSLHGSILIPGSKSHAIRAVVLASLAEGTSKILRPLESDDSTACLRAAVSFGAQVREKGGWIVKGFAGKPRTPAKELDLGNSGISTNFLAATAAFAKGPTILTGGDSLRSRPFGPICKAINDFGGKAESFGNSGKPPLKISGFLQGGSTEIDGLNSQPVSSLLMNCPVAKQDTEISVVNPHETPYVEMTMRWLDKLGIKYKASENFGRFFVEGEQRYNAFEQPIPADWSSAAFPLCAAAITPGSGVLLQGLDFSDSQGDKEIVTMLRNMGAEIKFREGGIIVNSSELHGAELDLNATPDALPALAVVGCFAEGETRLVNVAQARIKETDRIKAMAAELRKMGADVEELPDGLVVRKSKLKGAVVEGYNDHRTIMALAVAGLNAEGVTKISTAEGINKTYPAFIEAMKGIGAKMELLK